MKNIYLFIALGALFCAVLAKGALAFEASPSVSGLVFFDVNADDKYNGEEQGSAYARMRFLPSLNFNKNISLNSQIVLNSFTNPGDNRDQVFQNEGAFVQELNLAYKGDDYSLTAGKFNLNYGLGWDWTRGIWVWNNANNYRQTEEIGFSGSYAVGDAKRTGLYKFSVSNFTNDSKYLSNSLFYERSSVNKSQGAAGDTRSLQSYAFALDISYDFGEKEKLLYHFSYLDLAVNKRQNPAPQNKIADQIGYVAGMNYQYPVAENYDLDLLLEYSSMNNVGGNSDIYDRYITANAINRIYQDWNITTGYSSWSESNSGGLGFGQNLSEISFGYTFRKNDFFDKFLIQAGYKNQRFNYKTSLDTQNTVGVLLRYYKAF